MESKIPEEVKEMLEAYTKEIWNAFVVIGDDDDERDFMTIVGQLCRGAFIAGQKAAVEEVKKELFK